MTNTLKTALPALFIMILSISAKGQAEKVDAGIFPGATSDTLIIKARPDYDITGQSMTGALLTIRWNESSPVAEVQWLGSPIGLFPQGDVITADGFRYQVYGSFGGNTLNWSANMEYEILRVKTGTLTGDCAEFSIAQDEWTYNNNGDYYFEILGIDRTGIRYAPSVNYGTEGGVIDGDTTIYVGTSTGQMVLTAYDGEILQWERNHDQAGWEIIPETAGMESYEDFPILAGLWEYRVELEKPGCAPAYSDTAAVSVIYLCVWLGAVNDSWGNPENWNVAGVPDTLKDGLVSVTTSGYYPLISGDAFCRALKLEPGASATISPAGTLTLTEYLENNGTFTIRSDTNSAGSLLEEGITGAGVFISTFMLYPKEWHLFSSPATGAQAGELAELNLRSWVEAVNGWQQIPDANYILDEFTGYTAYCNSFDEMSISLEGGGYSTGTVESGLTNNGSGNGHTGGYNLLGNPYPSAINWNATPGWILDQVDPALYILNGETGNYGTYLRGDPGSSTLGIDSIIGTNQGFFVHVNHNSTAGSVSVSNETRLHSGQIISRVGKNRSDSPYLKFRISRNSSKLADEAVLRFREGATEMFDSEWDAYDFPGQVSAPQMFTRSADTLRLTVNTYPELSENLVIPMGFIPGETGGFRLELLEMDGFGPDTTIMLEDLRWNQEYELSPGFSLDISGEEGDDPGRFLLHVITNPVLTEEYSNFPEIKFTLTGRNLLITASDPGLSGSIVISDFLGKIIARSELSNGRGTVEYPFARGIYVAKVSGCMFAIVKKISLY